MYKFLLNCPEPPAKKTKSSEEKLEGQHSTYWEGKQNFNINIQIMLKKESFSVVTSTNCITVNNFNIK